MNDDGGIYLTDIAVELIYRRSHTGTDGEEKHKEWN